jgi:hypothetical protein
MLWVTSWASLQCPLFGVPHAVATHPWFIATLFDTYWAFVTFWVWVCFKQQSWLARSAWLIAILTLGNIAISLYCLSELFSLPANARASDVLTLRRQGPGFLGIVLAAAGIGVTVAAALHR